MSGGRLARNRLLTVKELASHLNVSEKTIYRKVYAGELPHLRVGKGIRFSWHEVHRVATLSGGSESRNPRPCGRLREHLAEYR